ncbi:hypothetical protein [Acinetobacter sp.]|uniref:hypothetical protein n=1 Tax=Acinetobacter sp. TaxID=472 RepID=UPI003D03D57B
MGNIGTAAKSQGHDVWGNEDVFGGEMETKLVSVLKAGPAVGGDGWKTTTIMVPYVVVGEEYGWSSANVLGCLDLKMGAVILRNQDADVLAHEAQHYYDFVVLGHRCGCPEDYLISELRAELNSFRSNNTMAKAIALAAAHVHAGAQKGGWSYLARPSKAKVRDTMLSIVKPHVS